ncbi:hypothetical protein D3C76_515960 [compost metagenome]
MRVCLRKYSLWHIHKFQSTQFNISKQQVYLPCNVLRTQQRRLVIENIILLGGYCPLRLVKRKQVIIRRSIPHTKRNRAHQRIAQNAYRAVLLHSLDNIVHLRLQVRLRTHINQLRTHYRATHSSSKKSYASSAAADCAKRSEMRYKSLTPRSNSLS